MKKLSCIIALLMICIAGAGVPANAQYLSDRTYIDYSKMPTWKQVTKSLGNGATFSGTASYIGPTLQYYYGTVKYADGSMLMNANLTPNLVLNGGPFNYLKNGQSYLVWYENNRLVREQKVESVPAAGGGNYGGYTGGYSGGSSSSGSSNYSNPAKKTTCPICHGSGACGHCGGKGYNNYTTMKGTHRTDCGVCHRTGKCQQCYGRGTIR